MMHEGGWTSGDLTDEDLNCRMFARDLGAVCVNVDYRLAPEHPFPTQTNDCWDVIKWCAATASPTSTLLPADPKLGFIVGGASAGGNLAAVMAQLSRDEKLNPPITGQYLCVGSFLWWDAVPEKWEPEYRSRNAESADPVIGKLKRDGGLKEAVKFDSKSPLFSPLLHPNLKDLAPAYFQVASLDRLRDESLIYERVLREENGVPTKIDLYEGFGHM
jgi:acetyl esterase/lipase